VSTSSAQLDPLQRRVLEVLADVEPRWTLVGGAALAGFYLHHRTTRDLDLFWRGRHELGGMVEACEALLRAHGLQVAHLQRTPAFARLRVSEEDRTVIVDLVADPGGFADPPRRFPVGRASIEVASLHDVLVDKLCALLGRSEVRDLVDLQGLLATDVDLDRALNDAPQRDAGFSPLTLAWVLRSFPVETLGRSIALPDADIAGLARFRDRFVERIAAGTRPAE